MNLFFPIYFIAFSFVFPIRFPNHKYTNTLIHLKNWKEGKVSRTLKKIQHYFFLPTKQSNRWYDGKKGYNLNIIHKPLNYFFPKEIKYIYKAVVYDINIKGVTVELLWCDDVTRLCIDQLFFPFYTLH